MKSLITDKAREWIGHEYPTKLFTVTSQDILKFAYATEETNPIYRDVTLAKTEGYRGQVAPPLFCFAIRSAAYHILSPAELGVDGTPASDLPPIAAHRSMAGQSETRLYEPICAGDELTVSKRVQDVYEKRGRSGPLVFVTFLIAIRNQHDELVTEETFTRVFR